MKKKHNQGKYLAKKKRAPIWLWLIPACVLTVSLVAVSVILIGRHKAREEFRQLAATVQDAQSTTEQTVDSTTGTTAPSVPDETGPEPTEPTGPLPQYQQLYAENPEMFGWLRIEGTVIDYPVMHTPDDPEKYLHRNFQGEDSFPGTPFIDYRCSEDSDNLVIYGHNMPDKSMFHSLMDYQQINYWKDHPVIRFDTVYREREFEVVAAFFDRVYYASEDVFKFYNFIDAADEAEYNDAVAEFRKKSIYDTGVTPRYGQQLITLVTCTYQTEHGRFVLVACEKDQHQ